MRDSYLHDVPTRMRPNVAQTFRNIGRKLCRLPEAERVRVIRALSVLFLPQSIDQGGEGGP